MKPKKNPDIDLEKKRGLFLQIGIAIALLIVLGAFQYRSYDKLMSLGELNPIFEFEEEIENTFRKKKVIPPPPAKIIEIVPNEKAAIEVLITPSEPDPDIGIDEPEPNVAEEVFLSVEQMPRFEGCLDESCTQRKIMQFIGANTQYPSIAKENNITGRVFVSFVVNKSGEVTDIKLLRGVDKYLDSEAIRVISQLPNFEPGRQRDKPVSVRYNIPISFKLN